RAHERDRRRPGARGAVPAGEEDLRGVHAVQGAAAHRRERPRLPVADRLPPGGVLAGVVAHGGCRQRDAREGGGAMKALLRLIVVAAALGVASAAGAQTKILRVVFPVAETGFDQAQISDLYSRTITPHIFESLYTYDPLARPYKIKPLTATAMPEVS